MRMLLSFSMVVNRPCWLAALAVLNMFWNPARAQNTEFRAVVAPGLQRAEAVVPHATGAFLVSSTVLPESNLLRGHVAHFDAELNVDWTRLLPCPAVFEEVLDAWSDAAGTLTVLTQRLTPLDGYQTVLHQLDSTGVWLGESLPEVPQGFRAATKVDWVGAPWLVGATGTQPVAVNLNTCELKTWGGAPGALDEVTDAVVVGSLMVAVGSRTDDDTTSTAIWGLYPLGTPAFEIVNPDPAAGAFSRADAVAANGSSVRVLHSFEPDTASNTLHSMLSVSVQQGEVVGILYGPSEGERPGRDLAWTDAGWLKLTQTDGFTELGQSMLLTHYSPNGTYLDQGAWGTAFEDDPAHVTQAEDGALWVAGSTRGFAGGTWDACVLRLDSIGPLGTWSNDALGLGVHNDDLFDDVLSINGPMATGSKWTCSPNPASEVTVLVPPRAGLLADAWTWTLLNARGQVVSTGTGDQVNVSRCAPGMHTVLIHAGPQRIHVNVLVASAR